MAKVNDECQEFACAIQACLQRMSIKSSLKLTPIPGKNPRDNKGRPYYLTRLPFYKKYPRFSILTGAIFCALLPISGQLYNAFFTKPEDIGYQDDWWPSEKARGKRVVDMWRERYEGEQIQKAENASKLAAAKSK